MEDETYREETNVDVDIQELDETREQVQEVLGENRLDEDRNAKLLIGTVRDVEMGGDKELLLEVEAGDGTFNCELPLVDRNGNESEAVRAFESRTGTRVAEPETLIGETVWVRYLYDEDSTVAFPPSKLQAAARTYSIGRSKSKDEPLFGFRADFGYPVMIGSFIGTVVFAILGNVLAGMSVRLS